jgi:hypothetical protein
MMCHWQGKRVGRLNSPEVFLEKRRVNQRPKRQATCRDAIYGHFKSVRLELGTAMISLVVERHERSFKASE